MMSKKSTTLLSGMLLLAFCRTESPDFIMAAGVVDGDVVTVKAAVSGEVAALNIREGDPIASDEVLATIDSKKIENQLQGLDIQEKEVGVNRKKLGRTIARLDTTRDYWKGQVESFERLEKKESISGDQLEQARLKLDEVEASLFDARQSLEALSIQLETIGNRKDQLRLTLKDHVVLSPVSGVVLEKFITAGETVFPGSPVADLLDRTSLYVETFLEGSELSGLELGQGVDILVDGRDDRVFTGIISHFGNKAEFSPKYILSEKERRSLLYQIKIRLDHDLEVFKLGMPVTIRFPKS